MKELQHYIPFDFRLLPLVLLFLSPFHSHAQKEIELEVVVPEKWQIDVALNYVLPAIAVEARKKGHSLTEQQLLKVVKKSFLRITRI